MHVPLHKTSSAGDCRGACSARDAPWRWRRRQDRLGGRLHAQEGDSSKPARVFWSGSRRKTAPFPAWKARELHSGGLTARPRPTGPVCSGRLGQGCCRASEPTQRSSEQGQELLRQPLRVVGTAPIRSRTGSARSLNSREPNPTHVPQRSTRSLVSRKRTQAGHSSWPIFSTRL